MKNKVFRIYRMANVYRSFVKNNLRSPVNKGIVNKLRNLPKGFLAESQVIYEFQKNDSKYYLSDLQRLNQGA